MHKVFFSLSALQKAHRYLCSEGIGYVIVAVHTDDSLPRPDARHRSLRQHILTVSRNLDGQLIAVDFRCKVQVISGESRSRNRHRVRRLLLTRTVIGVGSMEFPVFTSGYGNLPQPLLPSDAAHVSLSTVESSTPFSYLAPASVAFPSARAVFLTLSRANGLNITASKRRVADLGV